MKTALINANVITMDTARPKAEAVLIEGGRIARVGRSAEIASAADRVVDQSGRTILPGFTDAHVHVVWTGMALVGVDLIGATRIAEMIERVSERAAETPPGEWLFAHGFDESILEDRRPLTRHDLDQASRRHPILVRSRGGHCSVANTAALGIIGPDIPSRFPAGLLQGEANRLALAATGRLLSNEARMDAARRCADLALRRGVTTIHAVQRVAGEEDDFPLALRDASLPVRVIVYPTTSNVTWATRHGFPRIGGCLLVDGGIEPHTAALFGGYADRPDLSGDLYFSDEGLYRFLAEADAAGLQTAVHAIGERAIAQALDVHSRLPAARSLRHRIEHFLVPRREDVRRAADLGIAVCAQPAFERFWGGPHGWFERFLGAERTGRSTPLRSLLRAGARVGGGSDSYVTPMDPLLGIQSAVLHPNPAERISVKEALRLFTMGGALLALQECETGSITPGKRADLVVLSRDPTQCDPSLLAQIGVEETWVGGDCRWQCAPSTRG